MFETQHYLLTMRRLLFTCIIATLALCVNAQQSLSSVILKNGTELRGYIKSIDPSDALTMIISDKEVKIKMSEILQVNSTPANDSSQRDKSDVSHKERIIKYPYDPLAGYKGYLLEKGNNVYIYGDDSEFEKVGVNELRRLLIMDGFWNVVDNMNEAHFTINYSIKKSNGNATSYILYNTIYHEKEPDHVLLSVSSWRSNGSEFLKEYKIDNPDSKRSNELLSNKMYYEVIVPFQKSIENGKLKKKIREKFVVK